MKTRRQPRRLIRGTGREVKAAAVADVDVGVMWRSGGGMEVLP